MIKYSINIISTLMLLIFLFNSNCLSSLSSKYNSSSNIKSLSNERVSSGAENISSNKPINISNQKRILLLNSYRQKFSWTDDLTKGVSDVFKNHYELELDVKYINQYSFDNLTYRTKLYNIIKSEHENLPYDAVILADNNALDLMTLDTAKVFKDVPFVFVGANFVEKKDYSHLENVTGINEAHNVIGNLELIKKTMPDVNKIVVISGYSISGLQNLEALEKIVGEWNDPSCKIELYHDYTFAEFDQKIMGLDEKSAILFLSFYIDKTGKVRSHSAATKDVIERSSVAVFGSEEYDLPTGIVGGLLFNGYDQGFAGAELILSILSGTPANDIPVKMDTPTRIIFDYNKVKKYGIDLSGLNGEYKLINKPIPFLKQHERIVRVELFFIILLLLLILKIRSSTKKIKKSQTEYSNLFENINDAFILFDVNYDKGNKPISFVFNKVNPAFEKLTGISAKDIIGDTLYSRVATYYEGETPSFIEHFNDVVNNNESIQFFDYVQPFGIYINISAFVPEKNKLAIVFSDITEVKKAEKVLLEKVDKLTKPNFNINQLNLRDVFNLENLEIFQKNFYSASGVHTFIYDYNENDFSELGVGCSICKKLFVSSQESLEKCKKNTINLMEKCDNGIVIQTCEMTGFLQAAIDIVVDNKRVGTWIIGSVKDENFSTDKILKYAKVMNISREDVLTCLESMLTMSYQKFESYVNLLYFLSKQMSVQAYQNIMQARTLDSLEKIDERLRITLNSIGDAVIATDMNGIITLMNPIAQKLTGWSIESARGLFLGDVFNIINGTTRKRCVSPFDTVVETGKIVGLANHTILIDKFGKEYHIADSGSPIKNSEGEIIGVVLVFRDVTSEYKYAAKIATNKERFEKMFNNMIDGYAIHKMIYDEFGKAIDYEFLMVNPAYEKILNIAAKDVINKTLYEVFPTIDSFWVEQYAELLKTGTPLYLKHYEKMLNIHFDVCAFKVSNDEFAVSFKDVTDSYLATEKITQSEEELRKIFSSTKDAFIIHKRNGEIIRINNAMSKIFGVNEEEAKLLTIDDICLTESKTRFEVMEHAANLRDGETYNFETEGLYKDGTKFPIEVMICLFNNDSDTLIFLSIIRDLTEEKKMRDNLLQSQKMDAVGQLAGGIAHDFNNMLGGILGASELLEMEIDNSNCPDNSKFKRLLNIVVNSAERAADLTKNLLAFARKQTTDLKPISLHSSIKEALGLLTQTTDKKIEFVLALSASNDTLMGNFTELQNMVLNLALNSIHAMELGGKITINTSNIELDSDYCDKLNLTPGPYIQFIITDEGTGMTADVIKHLFEPFFTTKDTNKGTGLGMPAVYSSVKQHNAEIIVNSEVGRGTQFIINFPLTQQNKSLEEKEIGKVEYGEGTILVVDDERAILMTAKANLEYCGYKVLLAKDGLEAIELYQQYKDEIDIVIIDMIMPKMNGKECFFKLKEINNEIKVILTSGFTKSDQDVEKMREGGLIDFIQKPYKIAELSKVIAKAIKQ